MRWNGTFGHTSTTSDLRRDRGKFEVRGHGTVGHGDHSFSQRNDLQTNQVRLMIVVRPQGAVMLPKIRNSVG